MTYFTNSLLREQAHEFALEQMVKEVIAFYLSELKMLNSLNLRDRRLGVRN